MFNVEQRGLARGERGMSLAPVVIWLLTTYAGLSTAVAGFVLDNTALVVAGVILVGSGSVLANLVTKARNRSNRRGSMSTRKVSSASHCIHRRGR